MNPNVENRRLPRLLVSVRSLSEAHAACLGGCDILDLKEPLRGPLGMVQPEIISQIVNRVRLEQWSVPISAALGEVIDWQERPFPEITDRLDFVKIGCAQLGQGTSWVNVWERTRLCLQAHLNPGTRWVAVAYADWRLCNAPTIEEMVAATCDSDCRGLLIDTAVKSDRCLLDWLDESYLCEIAEQMHSQGRFLALAGRLTKEMISRIFQATPDYIAVRGSVCDKGNRTAEVRSDLVQSFRIELNLWPTDRKRNIAAKTS